jgi:hypothetical protein
MPSPTAREGEPSTIRVRTSRTLPLVALVWLSAAMGVLLYQGMLGGYSIYLTLLLAAVAIGIGLAMRFSLERPCRLVIAAEGIELPQRGMGLVKWREIVHIEGVTGGVAIFVTEEAAARLPAESGRDGFAFAAATPAGTRYLWVSDAGLECSAKEIAAELVARHNGAAGPLSGR